MNVQLHSEYRGALSLSVIPVVRAMNAQLHSEHRGCPLTFRYPYSLHYVLNILNIGGTILSFPFFR